MSQSYDFDLLPPQADARAAGRRARFRDPRTAAAFAAAPQPVRDYLRGAGFDDGTYHSGAPAGRFPADDDDDRAALIEQLAATVGRHDLPVAADGPAEAGEGFSLPAFLEAVMTAEPLPPDAPLLPPLAGEAVAAEPATPAPPLWRQLLRPPRWFMLAAIGCLAVWTVAAA
jgi:hypothetical protein